MFFFSLSVIDQGVVQRQVTKFRLSAHNLEIEKGKKSNMLCKLCKRNFKKKTLYNFRNNCTVLY